MGSVSDNNADVVLWFLRKANWLEWRSETRSQYSNTWVLITFLTIFDIRVNRLRGLNTSLFRSQFLETVEISKIVLVKWSRKDIWEGKNNLPIYIGISS